MKLSIILLFKMAGRQEEHPIQPEKMSDGVLVWSSIWSEVQIVCIIFMVQLRNCRHLFLV